MKKRFLAIVIILLVFSRCDVRAVDVRPETKEVTALVASFSPARLRLFNKKNSHTYHHRYKITAETQVIGIIRPGARVKVNYYLKKAGRGHFVKIAVRVEIIPVGQEPPQKPL
ncbi:MAG: hypothetical protein WC335_07825 [Candidatus Omnitrophota bacterium]|jgi:hypothetical protein